jgi:hypothetical protein
MRDDICYEGEHIKEKNPGSQVSRKPYDEYVKNANIPHFRVLRMLVHLLLCCTTRHLFHEMNTVFMYGRPNVDVISGFLLSAWNKKVYSPEVAGAKSEKVIVYSLFLPVALGGMVSHSGAYRDVSPTALIPMPSSDFHAVDPVLATVMLT